MTATATAATAQGSTKLWTKDPSVLFEHDTLLSFFPSGTDTRVENINSFMRFCIYSFVLLILNRRDSQYVYVLVLGLVVTFLFEPKMSMESFGVLDSKVTADTTPAPAPANEYTSSEDADYVPFASAPPQSFTECTHPTKDNPFMNFTMADMLNTDAAGNVKPKAPACDFKSVEKEAYNAFFSDVKLDATDFFALNSGQRDFYTMPSTDIVGDIESFRDFIAKDFKNCKTNSSDCMPSEDLRYSDRTHSI